jgi:hypothetical protein
MVTKGVYPAALFDKKLVWHLTLVRNADNLLKKVAGKLKLRPVWNQKLKDWLKGLLKK